MPRERRQRLRDRYKLGFDRLAVVALVLFAAAFGLMALAVNDPYGLPAPGTADRNMIETEVARQCVPDQIAALATLCRERVMSGYRWAHYRAALGADGRGWLYGGALAAVLVGAAMPAARWVIAGFRTPQPPDLGRPPPNDFKNG